MLQNSFYSIEELAELGLKSYGLDVLISRKCSIYGAEKISLGNHVRIDDFCILSGNISIGNYVHIGAYTALYGANGIEIGDYSGFSPRCTVFSASDDFSGNVLLGPTIPKEFTNVQGSPVVLERFANVGAGSILMPGVILCEGTVIGAMSLVRKSVKGWSLWMGYVPLEKIGMRSQKMKQLAEELEHENR